MSFRNVVKVAFLYLYPLSKKKKIFDLSLITHHLLMIDFMLHNLFSPFCFD